jgi:hypothetical protein
MKFIRRTAGYIKWGHSRYEHNLNKRKVKPAIVYTQKYPRKWKDHVKRMNTGRIPKQILHYELRGQRQFGRPVKRWEENMRL